MQSSHDSLSNVKETIPVARQVPWRRLFSYLGPYKWRMSIAIVGLTISSAISLAFPLLIGQTVTDILNQADYASLNQFVLLLLGLFIVMAIAAYIQTYFLGTTGERIVYDLRTQLYERMITLSLTYYNRHRVGEMMSRISNDVTMVRTMLTTNVSTMLSSLISLIGSVIIVFTLNAQLTVFILLLVPLLVAVAFILAGHWNG